MESGNHFYNETSMSTIRAATPADATAMSDLLFGITGAYLLLRTPT